jgi:hypothetical protein
MINSANNASQSAINIASRREFEGFESLSKSANGNDLIATANSNNPLEAGKALREIDSISGSRTTTNNLVQDGTRIAGNPIEQILGRHIDCDKIPQHLTAVTTSAGISGHYGFGGTAAVGRFDAVDRSNGRTYAGYFVNGGPGSGLGAGVSGNVSVTTVGRIPGISLEISASVPGATGTAGFVVNDNGNYEVNSAGIGPGAEVGFSANFVGTHVFGCTVK